MAGREYRRSPIWAARACAGGYIENRTPFAFAVLFLVDEEFRPSSCRGAKTEERVEVSRRVPSRG
jgi:hypothetical protein